MRNTVSTALLILLSLAVFSSSGTALEKNDVRGSHASSLIDKKGDLLFLFRDSSGNLRLASRRNYSPGIHMSSISAVKDISSPVLKQDDKDRTWAIWEEDSQENTLIFCGLIEENMITRKRLLSSKTGFHHSPDMTFDAQGNLWAVWIRYLNGKNRIIVRSPDRSGHWMIPSPPFRGAHNPRIAACAYGRIWVFWSGRIKCREQIYSSSFDGLGWSAAEQLTNNHDFPHILPDVGIDRHGFPRVVWSAFDGSDYELYTQAWDGIKWTDQEKITDSRYSDSYPSIGFALGEIPVIAWSRTSGNVSEILCKYKAGDTWSSALKIFESQTTQNILPEIASRQNWIGIVWQSGEVLRSEHIRFNQLITKQAALPCAAPPVYPGSRNENQYIGFGDSITFGYIDWTEAPDKGYIPRLEALLKDLYKESSKVINEGWPGEVTINGLARMPEVLSKHNAMFLLLKEGTNDVIFKKFTMDSTAFNLEQMIKTCREQGVYVILATIIPRADHRWNKKYFRDRIYELNDNIRNLASRINVPLIDFFDIFYNWPDDDGGSESLLSLDKVHPSEKGYIVMTENWFAEIQIIPFSATHMNVQREVDRLLFYRQEGNLVSWRDNTKLSDKTTFNHYTIYRRISGKGYPAWKTIETRSVKLIQNQSHTFFDTRIDPSSSYEYTITLERDDDVEGPPSKMMSDSTNGGNE